MKQSIKSAALGLLSAALIGTAATAYEPGVHETTRAGVTLGVPTGALPPPGVYMRMITFFYDANVTDRNGNNTNIHDTTTAYVPTLLWVPGWNFLGASYGAYIVQPFVSNATTLDVAPCPTPTGDCAFRNTMGIYKTLISPLNLSWNLGSGWFTSFGFSFWAPTGTIKNAANGLPPTAGTGGVGTDFWTFRPTWDVSYLGNGMNLTAHFAYEFNTENRRSQYKSGNLLYGNFTATKKVGKWEFGPVATLVWQTSTDTDPLGLYTTPNFDPINDRKSKQIAFGGLVGYDFGPAALNFIVTDDVYSRNTAKGWQFMTNLSFRLLGQEASPPPKRQLIHK